MDKKKIVVVGAGITGLTVAYRLLNSGENFEVIVLESEKQTGGVIVESGKFNWANGKFPEIGRASCRERV